MSIYYRGIKFSGSASVDNQKLSDYALLSGNNIFSGSTTLSCLSVDDFVEDVDSESLLCLDDEGKLQRLDYSSIVGGLTEKLKEELKEEIKEEIVLEGTNMIDLNSNSNFYGRLQLVNSLTSNQILSNCIQYKAESGVYRYAITFPKNMFIQIYGNKSQLITLNPSWNILASGSDSRIALYPNRLGNQLSSDPFEITLEANNPIYVHSSTISNLTANTYMSYYPVKPYIETEYDAIKTITADVFGYNLTPSLELYSDDDVTIYLSDIIDVTIKANTTGNTERTNSPTAPSYLSDYYNLDDDGFGLHYTFKAKKPVRISYSMSSSLTKQTIGTVGNPSNTNNSDGDIVNSIIDEDGYYQYEAYTTGSTGSFYRSSIQKATYENPSEIVYVGNGMKWLKGYVKYPLDETNEYIRSSIGSSILLPSGKSESIAIRSIGTLYRQNYANAFYGIPSTNSIKAYAYYVVGGDNNGYLELFDWSVKQNTMASTVKFTFLFDWQFQTSS